MFLFLHTMRCYDLCLLCFNIRDLKHGQRNARQRRSQPKEDWVEGFVLGGKTKVKRCVVLRRRRFLVLWLVALVMAFKNVRNLLLINHNDGFIDDDEFVVLYDLYAAKNLDFPYAGTFWPGKAWWVWPGFTCCQKNTKIYVFLVSKLKIYTSKSNLKLAQWYGGLK